MRALVLSGGGSHGAFQVGALKYLLSQEEDIAKRRYKVFCGISVGAINCAYLSQYHRMYQGVWKLIQLWKNLNTSRVRKSWLFGMVRGLLDKKSFYDTSPLGGLIESNFDAGLVQAAGNKLRVGAVGLKTGEFRIFDENYGELSKAILASSAFPTMFTPVELEDQLWIDGGIRNTTPLKHAIDIEGVDAIDVIMADPLSVIFNRDTPSNAAEVGLQVLETMIDEILNEDIEKALYYNRLAESGKTNKRFIDIQVIKPTEPLIYSPIDFDPDAIDIMMDIGYNSAKEQLQV